MRQMAAGIAMVATLLTGCTSTGNDSVATSPRMTATRRATPPEKELRKIIIAHCAHPLNPAPVREYRKQWEAGTPYPQDIDMAAYLLGKSHPLTRELVPCWNFAAG